MDDFCKYINMAPYNSFCTCQLSGNVCSFVRRCSNEMRWKPLSGIDKCRAKERNENMNQSKFKVRFEKRGILYIENGDFVVEIKNPFKEVPQYVDDIIEVEGRWFVKGFEPIREAKEEIIEDVIAPVVKKTKSNKK